MARFAQLDAPIATIDFEASAFDGYPIEVGMAIYEPGRPFISVWSSLIRPAKRWTMQMPWSAEAAQIHKVSREALATAPIARDVAQQLIQLSSTIKLVFCDGIVFDRQWLGLLMAECGQKPPFRLHDLISLRKALDLPPDTSFDADDDQVEHRAAADAQGLLLRGLRLSGRFPSRENAMTRSEPGHG